MEHFSYRREIYRKLFHLTSLWMPCAVYALEKPVALLLFTLVFFGMALFECLRRRQTPLGRWTSCAFGVIVRPHESGHLTGATYMVMAAWLVTALFPAVIAVTSLTVLMISDSLAALAGRRFGRHPLAGKSVEGSAAFFLSALMIVGTIEPTNLWWSGALACLAATGVELHAKRIGCDDNFAIPLTFALVQWLCVSL